ncbi:hypothetical protein [Chryseobacterium sp. SIMBA_038]|uniref:hypothetical protein n=1 Tax=Chryseobacterium sp. SIMBA_038 TaxID=3085780 RepID=UPI00397C4189
MENREILNVGKSMFWGSFILGNICLFGYLFTKNEEFAIGGYLLLIIGSIINFIVVCCLVIGGLINKNKFGIYLKSIGIILINIPLAIIYTIIGLSIIGF